MLKKLIIIFFLSLTVAPLFAQSTNTRIVSFGEQSKDGLYYSFSAGMGISYGNNPDLISYIGYELPNYNNLSDSRKLSDYGTGLGFFVAGEKQVAKNFSVKLDYNYLIKSNNLTEYPNYDYTTYSHNFLLTGYYLIPGDYFFLKFGAGAGPVFYSFNEKIYSNENSYKSTGAEVKLDAVLNVQIAKSMATYFGVFAYKNFAPALKDSDGNKLLNRIGQEVTPGSQGVGLRLGIEVVLF